MSKKKSKKKNRCICGAPATVRINGDAFCRTHGAQEMKSLIAIADRIYKLKALDVTLDLRDILKGGSV